MSDNDDYMVAKATDDEISELMWDRLQEGINANRRFRLKGIAGGNNMRYSSTKVVWDTDIYVYFTRESDGAWVYNKINANPTTGIACGNDDLLYVVLNDTTATVLTVSVGPPTDNTGRILILGSVRDSRWYGISSTDISHDSILNVSSDDHHAQSHALGGGDHTGDLVYSQIDAIVDTSGTGANNLLSRADHVHTAADGSSKVTYSNLSGIPSTFTPANHDIISKHTGSPGTVGYVIRASGASAFAWAQLGHGDLSGIGSNAHSVIDTHLGASNPHSGSASDSELSTHASDTSTHGKAEIAGIADLHAQSHTHDSHTGTLTYLEGGTGQSTYVKGDLLWASAANVLSRLGVSGASQGDVLTIGASSVLGWEPSGTPGAHDIDGASHTLSGSAQYKVMAADSGTVFSFQDLVYSHIDQIVDTSGGGATNLISRADHVHTAGDGSSKVTYSNLLSIPSTFAPTVHSNTVHSPNYLASVLGDTTPQLGGELDFYNKRMNLNATAVSNHNGVGIIINMTAAQSLVFPNLVYVNSNGDAALADADSSSNMPAIGMALETKSVGQTIKILVFGFVYHNSWAWAVGGGGETRLLYVSNTTGGMTQTPPSGTNDQVQVVATVLEVDRILFNPSYVLVEIN